MTDTVLPPAEVPAMQDAHARRHELEQQADAAENGALIAAFSAVDHLLHGSIAYAIQAARNCEEQNTKARTLRTQAGEIA